MTSNGDGPDFRGIEEAIPQKEEDMNSWCPSSGRNVGSMIEFPARMSGTSCALRAGPDGPEGARCSTTTTYRVPDKSHFKGGEIPIA